MPRPLSRPRRPPTLIHLHNRRAAQWYCGVHGTEIGTGCWTDDITTLGAAAVGFHADAGSACGYDPDPGKATCPTCVSIYRTHGCLSERQRKQEQEERAEQQRLFAERFLATPAPNPWCASIGRPIPLIAPDLAGTTSGVAWRTWMILTR